MRIKKLTMVCAIVLTPGIANSQTAPEGLRNKSVTVSWTVNRSLRVVGEGDFRDTVTPFSLSVYISSAGRPFARISATPGRRTGSAEAVGTSGATQGGGSRQVRFSGNTMQIAASAQGGARLVTVEISGGSCNARVMVGKEAESRKR